MLEAIISALNARTDLTGWAAQQINTRGAQLYAVLASVESRRRVSSERYAVEVFRTTLVRMANHRSAAFQSEADQI